MRALLFAAATLVAVASNAQQALPSDGVGHVGGIGGYDAISSDRLVSGAPAVVCGDDEIGGDEVCDGTDLDSETCVTQGYSGGTLACAGDCTALVVDDCYTEVSQLYFPSTGAAPVTPVANASWDVTSATISYLALTTTTQAVAEVLDLGVSWSPGQFAKAMCGVSAPLAAQTLGGTITARIKARESSSVNNAFPASEVYVVTSDGGTVRGTVVAKALYTSGIELIASTPRSRGFFGGGASASAVAVTKGDRLVVCVGASDDSGTTPNARVVHGNDTADADCPVDDGSSTACRSWVAFSQALRMAP